MSRIGTELQALVSRRLQRLRALSLAELSLLPECVEEIELVGKREVAVATYRDVLPDGRTRVMVQAYLSWFVGISRITADGFLVAADGTQSPVSQEMIWEFE